MLIPNFFLMEEGTCPTCGGPKCETCGGCKNCGTCTCEAGGEGEEKKPEGGDAYGKRRWIENGGGDSSEE